MHTMTGGDGGQVDVLIVGAGPTGLAAACEAVRHGLTVRIVDRAAQRSTFSRALVVHARTLEVFSAMGVSDAILAAGTRFAALNAHAGRRRRAVRLDLLGLPWGDTEFPFWLSIPQHSTESVLQAHLSSLGTEVEWAVTAEDVRDREDRVETRLRRSDGGVELVRSNWVIGCDGGRSLVRQRAGLRLNRTDAAATFVLADVKTTARLTQDEGYVFLHPQGLLLIVPMPEPGRWRIIAHVAKRTPGAPAVDAAFLDELIRHRAGIDFGSHDITWQSHFDLSHGVADHYRRGRVFIAGDAAHVHSPVGGQGLNTGLQDAHNLLWKLGLAARLEPAAADVLLDSYEAERRPVAAAMVTATARVTRALTRRGIRLVLGAVGPVMLGRARVQARFGRQVGMLDLGYSGSPLVHDAPPVAGRRMPNPRLPGGSRLHHRLDPVGHTWVVSGVRVTSDPDSADPQWHGLPVVSLSGDALDESVDGRLPPVILVRPDRYVAAAADSAPAAWDQLTVPPVAAVRQSR